MKKVSFSILASVSLCAQTTQPVTQPIFQLAPQINEEEKKAKDLKEYIKANYTKNEFLIPMRDGVRLFTAVYTPKSEAEPAPFLIMRTPYTVAPYGIDNSSNHAGPFGESSHIRASFLFIRMSGAKDAPKANSYTFVRTIRKKHQRTSMSRAIHTTPSSGC